MKGFDFTKACFWKRAENEILRSAQDDVIFRDVPGIHHCVLCGFGMMLYDMKVSCFNSVTLTKEGSHKLFQPVKDSSFRCAAFRMRTEKNYLHMEKGGCVYIMSNKHNTTIYTGVTSDLISRVYEHKNSRYPNSFTSKYKCYKLIYYETFHSIEEAIRREKEIKGWKRFKKDNLIDKINPERKDLHDEILNW